MQPFNELLGAVAASAFSQNSDLRPQIIPGLEVRLWLAVLVDAFVVGANAGHTHSLRVDAVVFKQELRAGKSGEDRDAGLFDFLSEPFYELVDRDDVVAMIPQRGRDDGQLAYFVFGQKINGFLRDLGIERRF